VVFAGFTFSYDSVDGWFLHEV